MAFCAKCGAQYDETVGGCPACARYAVSAPPAPAAFAMPMDRNSLMAFGGALLLLIGTFLPVLKLSVAIVNADYSLLGGGPFMDQMNQSADSPTSSFMMIGIILALLAVGTAVLVFMKIWPGLWATGGAALVVIGYGFFTLNSKISEAVKAAGESAAAVSSAIQPGWGWAVLLVGALLVLAAAFMSMQKAR